MWNSIREAKRKEKKRKKKKSEDSLRNLWDNMKRTNICIIKLPEEEREKGAEILLEEMIAKNFPCLGKETDIKIQEAQRVPNKRNPKRPTP